MSKLIIDRAEIDASRHDVYVPRGFFAPHGELGGTGVKMPTMPPYAKRLDRRAVICRCGWPHASLAASSNQTR